MDRPFGSLSPSDIRTYVGERTENGVTLPREFSRRPRLQPCKLATAGNDLRMLAVMFNKIQGESMKGSTEKPFRTNPFSWLTLPEAEKALRQKPTARRFEILMDFVDLIDPTGQLRLALVLARWHGCRIGAVSKLSVEDLRLTVEQMLSTLGDIAVAGHQPQDGIQGPDFAHEFLQGALFYADTHDKEGYRRLVPLSRVMRTELDAYLAKNPGLDPAGPLFPSAEDPSQPTGVPEFIARLHATEELARTNGFAKEVPVLYDSAFHGYRGLRATELENQGHRPAHVNFLVGWTCKRGEVKSVRYVMHSGKLLYAAVEGLRPIEADAEYQRAVAQVEEENERLRVENAEKSARMATLLKQNAALIKQIERMGAQLDRMEKLLAASSAA